MAAHPSYFVKAVAKLFIEGSRTAKVLKEGMQMVVGNGDKALFWTDIQVDLLSLKDSFPRIDALVDNKAGSISKYGCPGLVLLAVGQFTVGFFRRAIEEDNVDDSEEAKHIWHGICPPKVELFMWQLSKNRVMVKEVPPMSDRLKFNVDGSAIGKPGPAGVGGVLRDSNGKVLCMFSLFVGNQDSNSAEVLAIEKACQLCISNPRLMGRKFDIVSDSKVVVLWITNEGFGSLNHVNQVYNIRNILSLLKGTVVLYNSRATNSFADNLDEMGSSMARDFIEWGDV
ncbi:hypothetical protein Dsin_002945 [Dipteronia sinensis]|uniref:RNase H type-1 domain-containing protein n=1 Tax=Dipteronia sinensis TaxID=43782 RepID=A0AAE0B8H5_9ROSI|nr:hypothetical protein Dsin_002945 [Dipteronia sinensis]